MRMSRDKDIAKVVRDYIRKGWLPEVGGKHHRLRAPDGGEFIVVPSSPSDRRAAANFTNLIRKMHERMAMGASA